MCGLLHVFEDQVWCWISSQVSTLSPPDVCVLYKNINKNPQTLYTLNKKEALSHRKRHYVLEMLTVHRDESILTFLQDVGE